MGRGLSVLRFSLHPAGSHSMSFARFPFSVFYGTGAVHNCSTCPASDSVQGAQAHLHSVGHSQNTSSRAQRHKDSERQHSSRACRSYCAVSSDMLNSSFRAREPRPKHPTHLCRRPCLPAKPRCARMNCLFATPIILLVLALNSSGALLDSPQGEGHNPATAHMRTDPAPRSARQAAVCFAHSFSASCIALARARSPMPGVRAGA